MDFLAGMLDVNRVKIEKERNATEGIALSVPTGVNNIATSMILQYLNPGTDSNGQSCC